MDHDIVAVQAQQHRREDRVVIRAGSTSAPSTVPNGGHARRPVVVNPEPDSRRIRIAAEDRPLGEIVAAADGRRQPFELRMDERTVVTLGIVLHDQFPVGRNLVIDSLGFQQRGEVPALQLVVERSQRGFGSSSTPASETKMKPPASATRAGMSG